MAVRIVTMLLHDERFSGWSLQEKLTRLHFSKQYLRFCKSFGWEPYLYCFHHALHEMQVYEQEDLGVMKVFPVEFRFPPFLGFGNDHAPRALLRELIRDAPDLVHFHHYYLFAFPYIARFVKTRLSCPLTVQLHGYHQRWRRRLAYTPSLLALRRADRIFYSYQPETAVYQAFKVLEKAVHVPMPSFDPRVFTPGRKRGKLGLLYVGRIPLSLRTYGEKAPILLLSLLYRLLPYQDVTLTLVGDGGGLPYCQRLAARLGLDGHVEFTAYLPHEALPARYQAAWLTVIPMELEDIDGYFDGAIQESLACGTSVAALKASPRTPAEGSLGFLLPKSMPDAAAEVATLLDAPETLGAMARKGARFVHQHCTEARLKETLRREWEGVLKR